MSMVVGPWGSPQRRRGGEGVGGGWLTAGAPLPWWWSSSWPKDHPPNCLLQLALNTTLVLPPQLHPNLGSPLATCQLLCTHLPKGVP